MSISIKNYKKFDRLGGREYNRYLILIAEQIAEKTFNLNPIDYSELLDYAFFEISHITPNSQDKGLNALPAATYARLYKKIIYPEHVLSYFSNLFSSNQIEFKERTVEELKKTNPQFMYYKQGSDSEKLQILFAAQQVLNNVYENGSGKLNPWIEEVRKKNYGEILRLYEAVNFQLSNSFPQSIPIEVFNSFIQGNEERALQYLEMFSKYLDENEFAKAPAVKKDAILLILPRIERLESNKFLGLPDEKFAAVKEKIETIKEKLFKQLIGQFDPPLAYSAKQTRYQFIHYDQTIPHTLLKLSRGNADRLNQYLVPIEVHFQRIHSGEFSLPKISQVILALHAYDLVKHFYDPSFTNSQERDLVQEKLKAINGYTFQTLNRGFDIEFFKDWEYKMYDSDVKKYYDVLFNVLNEDPNRAHVFIDTLNDGLNKTLCDFGDSPDELKSKLRKYVDLTASLRGFVELNCRNNSRLVKEVRTLEEKLFDQYLIFLRNGLISQDQFPKLALLRFNPGNVEKWFKYLNEGGGKEEINFTNQRFSRIPAYTDIRNAASSKTSMERLRYALCNFSEGDVSQTIISKTIRDLLEGGKDQKEAFQFIVNDINSRPNFFERIKSQSDHPNLYAQWEKLTEAEKLFLEVYCFMLYSEIPTKNLNPKRDYDTFSDDCRSLVFNFISTIQQLNRTDFVQYKPFEIQHPLEYISLGGKVADALKVNSSFITSWAGNNCAVRFSPSHKKTELKRSLWNCNNIADELLIGLCNHRNHNSSHFIEPDKKARFLLYTIGLCAARGEFHPIEEVETANPGYLRDKIKQLRESLNGITLPGSKDPQNYFEEVSFNMLSQLLVFKYQNFPRALAERNERVRDSNGNITSTNLFNTKSGQIFSWNVNDPDIEKLVKKFTVLSKELFLHEIIYRAITENKHKSVLSSFGHTKGKGLEKAFETFLGDDGLGFSSTEISSALKDLPFNEVMPGETLSDSFSAWHSLKEVNLKGRVEEFQRSYFTFYALWRGRRLEAEKRSIESRVGAAENELAEAVKDNPEIEHRVAENIAGWHRTLRRLEEEREKLRQLNEELKIAP